MYKDKYVHLIFASSAYAQDGKRIIGYKGDMPWRGKVRSDMERFVELTSGKWPLEPSVRQAIAKFIDIPEVGHSMIMGRKTKESIPTKFWPFDKNLPTEKARQSIVVTRNTHYMDTDPRVLTVHSVKEALDKARSRVVWIIGGAEIYKAALPIADVIHETVVHERCEGDTFFPFFSPVEWHQFPGKHLVAGDVGAEKDKVNSTYIVYERTHSMCHETIIDE